MSFGIGTGAPFFLLLHVHALHISTFLFLLTVVLRTELNYARFDQDAKSKMIDAKAR